MDEIKKWADNISLYRLPRWEQLPDIELYMDQVLEMVERYLRPLFAEKTDKIITATMINNYVKLNLIPKPEKKRYRKKHIASILAITILKQILPISDISKGIALQTNTHGAQGAFDLFCQAQENALQVLKKQLSEGEIMFQELEKLTMDTIVLNMVTVAFASKIVTEKMLDLQVVEQQPKSEKMDKKNKECSSSVL
ncbi:MAG: DUF1836 domain-containing protein [Culicoidibacterales bacterium]